MRIITSDLVIFSVFSWRHDYDSIRRRILSKGLEPCPVGCRSRWTGMYPRRMDHQTDGCLHWQWSCYGWDFASAWTCLCSQGTPFWLYTFWEWPLTKATALRSISLSLFSLHRSNLRSLFFLSLFTTSSKQIMIATEKLCLSRYVVSSATVIVRLWCKAELIPRYLLLGWVHCLVLVSVKQTSEPAIRSRIWRILQWSLWCNIVTSLWITPIVCAICLLFFTFFLLNNTSDNRPRTVCE